MDTLPHTEIQAEDTVGGWEAQTSACGSEVKEPPVEMSGRCVSPVLRREEYVLGVTVLSIAIKRSISHRE